ncbi:MAG: hypothetical protein ACE5EN_00500 [Nitrospinota bacterium]
MIKRLIVLGLILVPLMVFQACTSGGVEDKYAKVFSDINKDWELYEVKQAGGSTIIKVEVINSDKVPFKEAKKAMEALQKMDPKLSGYIEFYNSEVGIVLRKVEIIPAAT